ncbi:hypothetical protein HXP44_29625 [Streptomyces sioyaensis]|uniref:DUF4062 domain-containing protein n=1 Tax=Streptomyces sioyaensis TaxID=67364 RepID=A0A4Q1QTX6_9ACTN|nr:hypothetical protein [Streptomyces sioyaensis]MBM4796084.1 hypothetical protein [Streptomyces sioyaensis]RXS61256.1 hypothetical protein EST54_26690 [Streptomyces sioyaensis]
MLEARVLRIFIGSPGDISDDKSVVRECINNWNSYHAPNRGIVFLPVTGEDVSPDSRSPAQRLINAKAIAHCDALIAPFWTSIGTRTKDAISGTVNEIEEFQKDNKRAAIFFCHKDVPTNRTAGSNIVRRFERKLHSVDSGLTSTYKIPDTLRQKVDALLVDIANEAS